MKPVGAMVAALALGSAALEVSAAAPKSQYVIQQDTVLDKKTGLTWQQAIPERQFSWREAKDYCSSLRLGGFSTGWRLPERLELASLVDLRIALPGPTIDQLAFPEAPSGWFWTATPCAGESDNAWYVSFYIGSSGKNVKVDTGWVRCVR